MRFAYFAYFAYLSAEWSQLTTKVTFLIQKRNTLHIPLAMHVQGWQNGLAGKNWRHALPPLWDSSIRSSSMHKEKALIIEGEINSGRKKGLKGPGETQDGLHGKKKGKGRRRSY